VDFASLPRRHLQDIAKSRGIKANLKSTEIIAQLQHLDRGGKAAGAKYQSTEAPTVSITPNRLHASPAESPTASSMDLSPWKEAANTIGGDGQDSPSLTWQTLHEMLHAQGTDGAMNYLSSCLAHLCSSKPGRLLESALTLPAIARTQPLNGRV
jgi:hypothetical protein